VCGLGSYQELDETVIAGPNASSSIIAKAARSAATSRR
jgi:hypothetical protein